jgi:hypothetical protein
LTRRGGGALLYSSVHGTVFGKIVEQGGGPQEVRR